MAKYLISFPGDAMDRIPAGEMPEVAKAVHAVCQEAISSQSAITDTTVAAWPYTERRTSRSLHQSERNRIQTS